MAARELVTPMSAAVLTPAQAKVHLHVDADHTMDDELITSLIGAAAQDCEATMGGRALLPQTWRQRLDAWPAGPMAPVELGPATVTGITGISYITTAGATVTLDAAGAAAITQLVADPLCALLYPAYGTTWPAVRQQPAAITITYTCSTWATAAEVPALVLAWIKLRLCALYYQREAWTVGKAIEPNPHIDRLLDRWCLHRL